MERRIKILYIITIVAILAFLGMQIYWLNSRYQYSLTEYENQLRDSIENVIAEYNDIRASEALEVSSNKIQQSRLGIEVFTGDTVRTKRTTTVVTFQFKAQELLGLPPETLLTPEQKNKAAQMAAEMEAPNDANTKIFDSSNAPNENAAWGAARKVSLEDNAPFTKEGIDSLLLDAGMKVSVKLCVTDSMIWRTYKEHHRSILHSTLELTIPYSELECKSVIITVPISIYDVIPSMADTLTVAGILSTLLIVCLVLQFSTVLKLSRLDKMRNSFITTMIHELKRPLSTLKMCVSGLDNERMMKDEVIKKEILSETRNALDNLSAYFSKLRDITFNNVEQIPLNIRSVNLRELFDTIAADVEAPVGKTVVISNDIVPDSIVSADRAHLYNILNNLVENAVKYSGAEVKITATAAEKDGCVELKISDTGNGIPSGDLKHIFQRFYRGKASSGEQPGMGLGLAYVKLLIEAHGGSVIVESSEGTGSCFTIRLPQ